MLGRIVAAAARGLILSAFPCVVSKTFPEGAQGVRKKHSTAVSAPFSRRRPRTLSIVPERPPAIAGIVGMAILKIIGLDVRIAFNAAGAIVCGAIRIATTGIEMAGYVAREGYEMADNVLNNHCRAPAARSTVCATLRCRSASA